MVRSPVIAGYYPGWSDVPFADILADRMTDVIYAFANIDGNGHCFMPNGRRDFGNFAAPAALKDAHPGLRVAISIGGWDASGFSEAASSERSRWDLVRSCIDLFFRRYAGVFDGIDVGPSDLSYLPADRLQSAGPYDPNQSFELWQVGEILDFVNLMTRRRTSSNAGIPSLPRERARRIGRP